jgi:hypothetical protein
MMLVQYGRKMTDHRVGLASDVAQARRNRDELGVFAGPENLRMSVNREIEPEVGSPSDHVGELPASGLSWENVHGKGEARSFQVPG